MDQRWKRLSLLVIILVFWRNADGFKGGVSSSAHHGWGQPSDAFSPRAVQSSMSEVRLTGFLPVEEVGSSLFPNKPLKSKSKLNLLQFVKGGSSSYQSTSHAQTTPSSSVSASLPLSLNQQPSCSLASSGSTIPGVAGGLSLETQYAASGLGQVVSTLGESSSYPAKLGVSGQSTSDTLHVSSSQETAVQLAETSLPVFSKKVSYSSSSAPGVTSTSRSSPALLSQSLGQPVSSQGEVGYSGLSQGASNQYTPDSNTMLGSTSSQPSGDQSSPSVFGSSSQGSSETFLASGFSLLEEVAGLRPLDLSSKSPETSSQFQPLVVSSQSTSVQSSPSVSTLSTQSRSGPQLVTSSHFIPVQGGSSSVSLYLKPPGTLGRYAPAFPAKYTSTPVSAPQATTNSGSSYRAVSQVGSPSQMGASGQFTSLGGNYYRGLLPQSRATSSQYALGYSKPISSPQSTSSQSTSALSS
ncbi:flocculation protein FLO11-like [Sinocyclocheilus rhinocerous]|uniref:flocculation protein FLO11-like n=1 Tax=Sinocyclocheilus rhinocerous TaxID=307959 RepID=UPI0007B9C71A|nr:PREDICTED: flocculation protein FLO11-like [Sinocyclocheilus rhinocerous]